MQAAMSRVGTPHPTQALDPGIVDEERRWIQETLAGDLSAFDQVVERYWRKVASVVGRFVEDPNEVEDVVQETFIRAFQGLRSFRGDAGVQTWLLRIAVNLCKSRRRGFWQRRVTRMEDAEALALVPDAAATLAEGILLDAEWQQLLHQAIRQLPDKFRTPILLHYFEGLTGAEIAEVLGWPLSTVWSRIYAGCRRLRAELADYREA